MGAGTMGPVAVGEIQVGSGTIPVTLVLRFGGGARLADVREMPKGPDRRETAWAKLGANAEQAQASALAIVETLKSQGLVNSHEQLRLPNALIVRTTMLNVEAAAQALAGAENLAGMTADHGWLPAPGEGPRAEGPSFPMSAQSREPTRNADWSIRRVRAPQAWKAGATGRGVRVGIVDSGADVRHPALARAYAGRGQDGTVEHDGAWLDPYRHAADPRDGVGHGTAVGSIVSRVAPDAKLLFARGMEGAGTTSREAVFKALQFMLAPTDTRGRSADPRAGVDVLNLSFGERDPNASVLRESLEGLRDAGVEVITASGNSGPSRGTVKSPASLGIGIDVGNTQSDDRVKRSSGRGPSVADPYSVHPLVAAPGTDVEVATAGGGYRRVLGTSFSSPHVAGVVALMLSANPAATDSQIRSALASTAKDLPPAGPDDGSGYGLVNAEAAVRAIRRTTPG